MPFSRAFQAWKSQHFNSRTFQGLYKPYNNQNEIFQIAKHMVKERHDITESNCLKGILDRVTVDEKGVKDS